MGMEIESSIIFSFGFRARVDASTNNLYTLLLLDQSVLCSVRIDKN